MKKFLAIVLALITVSVAVFAEEPDTIINDESAIEETVLNYIEGWYTGDAARMEMSLHPDLAKRTPRIIQQTGRTFLDHVGAASMVEFTKAGAGKIESDAQTENTIEILDVYNNITTVKLVSKDFVDYIHLVKCSGEWKIVNVLWEKIE